MISLLYRIADRLRSRRRRRISTPDFAAGRRGEDLAHRYLRKHGFTVIARNYRPRGSGGEIDLIAWDGDHLAFIEVKSRATDEFGAPDRAVHREKQIRIDRAAREYCRRANIPWDRVRFDIVNVILGEPVTIELLRDAFRPLFGGASEIAGTSQGPGYGPLGDYRHGPGAPPV